MSNPMSRGDTVDPVTDRSGRPEWWTERHASAWDRVKEALRRDWEQTKADFTLDDGTDLNQNVGDTVKQAIGREPIPSASMKTHPDDPRDLTKLVEHENREGGEPREWNRAEPAVRYGYVARMHYVEVPRWDDEFEVQLEQEWTLLQSGSSWDDMRRDVRHGWDAATRNFFS